YYTNDLSFEHVHALLKLFLNLVNQDIYQELATNQFELTNSGITKSSFQFEVDKAEIIQKDDNIKREIFCIEDFKYTRGDIHNFLAPDIKRIRFYNKSIREIYSKDDSAIIRSMLTVDNYSLHIGWTYIGSKYFFGKENNWEIILTAPDKSDFYKKYLNTYKQNNKSLDEISSGYLTLNGTKDWMYYFIKYPEMSSPISGLSHDNNIYAWRGDFTLEKMGGSNLNAYHQNPYISTVAKKLNTTSYFIQYDYLSYFEYNKLTIYSDEDGWRINNFDKQEFPELTTKYNLIENDKSFTLKV
ncbi:unnamed protein product, partial [marine sediment metagenome]